MVPLAQKDAKAGPGTSLGPRLPELFYMTDEQRYQDLIAFGYRLRDRIRGFIEEVNAMPDEPGPVQMALNTWRVA